MKGFKLTGRKKLTNVENLNDILNAGTFEQVFIIPNPDDLQSIENTRESVMVQDMHLRDNNWITEINEVS